MLPFIRNTAYKKRAFILGLVAILMAAAPLGAHTKQLSVVASIKPIHSLVAGVMGDQGTLSLLLDSALDPHIFSMKSSDIRKVINADILFYVDPELETFLSSIVSQKHYKLHAVRLAAQEDILLLPYRTSKVWFSEEQTSDQAGNRDHTNPQAAQEAMDLHIWLHPANARRIVTIIEETLSRHDPDNRLTYIRNAKLLIKRLYDLEERVRDQLRPMREKPLIVYHDAIQYFERAFNLKSVGAIQLKSDAPPSVKHLRALRKIAREKSVACVLGAPGSHPRIATVVMGDTQAGYDVIDPLGLYLDPGPELYFELIEEISLTLQQCQPVDSDLFDIDPQMD
tara:strand:- start:487 stop:1503 length:1017 start_codon:yes stop_codon:yes gene_type:complete